MKIRTWEVTAINKQSGGGKIAVGDFYSVREAADFVDANRPAAVWRHVKILSREKHWRD